jgi:hypothetical protein
MIITKKELEKLHKDFAGLFEKKYLIQMGFFKHPQHGLVVLVKVSVMNGCGDGQEFLTLDFASKLLKEPKELEQYYLRWQRGFASAKMTPTLDLSLTTKTIQ